MKVNEIITQTFLDVLKEGKIPWRMPWDRSGHKNLKTKSAYSGVNIWLLSMSRIKNKFSSSYWLTYKQAKALKGNVKKGAKGTHVIFWKLWEKSDGEEIPVLRYYTVFNVDQVDGVEAPKPENARQNDPIAEAEKIVQGYTDSPKVDWTDETRAYYVPAADFINMPKRELFHSPEEVYSTLFHEFVHSTGHETRLKRQDKGQAIHFGDKSYSREELVAELGSAFLCGESGIGQNVIQNQKAYIQNWMKALKNDPAMIIHSAGKAQKAYEYILKIKKEKKK